MAASNTSTCTSCGSSGCNGSCGQTISLCDVIAALRCIKDFKGNCIEKRQQFRPTTPTTQFNITAGTLPLDPAAIKVAYNGSVIPFGAPGAAGPAWAPAGGNSIILTSPIGEPQTACVLEVQWSECETVLDVWRRECNDIYQKFK